MTFFPTLDLIADVERDTVGEKALFLNQLHQYGFPIVPGNVLGAQSWATWLSKLLQATHPHLENLSSFALEHPIALQEAAHTLQRALLKQPLPLDAAALATSFQSSWLILRPSLSFIEPSQPPLATDLTGLVPAQICLAEATSLLPALRKLWAESLRAYNLVTWRKFCQSLMQIRLATIIQPLYPARVSGTLILGEQGSLVEAVLGLGVVLVQGEAIPARCHVPPSMEPGHWQSGYQERVHLLQQTSDPPGLAKLVTRHRDSPELPCPLTKDQLDCLLQLGSQVRQAFQRESPTIRLEWVLYTELETGRTAIALTQATPWIEPLVEPLDPSVVHPARPRSAVKPSILPLVQAMVQGIGAAPGKVMAPAVVFAEGTPQPENLPADCIVVVPDLHPEMGIQLGKVAGIITLQGGATCHAAILARELGIPAVVGAPQATDLLSTGDVLWLDGDRGLVYLLPEDQIVPPLASVDVEGTDERRPAPLPLSESKPRHTQVMLNLSQAERLADVPLTQVDGVGLLRSEWLLVDAFAGRHPQHWIELGLGADLETKIVEKLAPILATFAPKPVRYRSLDLRLQERGVSTPHPTADLNPILGIHGTLSYQLDPRLFEIELSALAELQRRGHTNLQLMLPFVRTVEEFVVCRQWVDRAGLFQVRDFQLWIMAEVPSILFLLPAYRQAGVQGIAIGTNDLTQLLLAVDRNQPAMSAAYDERHPAVLAALAHLIQTARQEGMPCSICGQAPVRYPELIESFVQWGIDAISVELSAVAATHGAVLKAEQRWQS